MSTVDIKNGIASRETVVGPNIVRSGSVFYINATTPYSYPGSGDVWSDLSQNRYTGSFISSSTLYTPFYDSTNGGSIAFKLDPVVAAFGGSGIDYMSGSAFQNILGTNFTVNAWVKYSTNSVNSVYGGVITALRNQYGVIPILYNVVFQMGIDSSNAFYFGHQWAYSGQAFVYSSGADYDKWYNIVGVRNNNTSSLYVNGIYQGQASVDPDPTYLGTPTLTVGYIKFPYNGNTFGATWTGSIASVNIYNRVLSDNEIQQNYNALRGLYGL